MSDLIDRQAVLAMQYRIDDSATLSTRDVVNVEDIEDLPSVSVEPSCKNCKHYFPGEYDGSCGSYICKNKSGWEEQE